MRRLLTIILAVMLCGCSSQGNNTVAKEEAPLAEMKTLASFPYKLVKWNNHIYRISEEKVSRVYEEIGEITIQSSNEPADSPNNFSTTFPAGTKLFSLHGVETSEAIAIRISKNDYIKAIAEH
ncbi:hypothetical protein FHS15_004090 [Paenibacillus castaneae]|uniref:hypothetical protein n=1 Tax=Paenibacillus castaneae TaxID=474957 RepID=UPI000C9BB20A|nr:hypothetical protein [Paenibacillus castaneae]NIK78944.1 hypothetical protein [Paenibacillus castaneae]